MDGIVLKNRGPVVIASVVAGDAANPSGDAFLNHGDAASDLTAYRAVDVRDYRFMLRELENGNDLNPETKELDVLHDRTSRTTRQRP